MLTRLFNRITYPLLFLSLLISLSFLFFHFLNIANGQVSALNYSEFQWADRENSGTGNVTATDVATDSSGNVYVTGYFAGTVNLGAGSWTSTGNDFFIVKYSSSGAFQWSDREDSGTGSVTANSVVTDSSGNVFVAGSFQTAAVDFGAGSWTPISGDYFVVKYNSSGAFQWADREDSGTGNALAQGVATDSSGNVFV